MGETKVEALPTYLIQVGPTTVGLTPSLKGGMERIDLQGTDAKTLALACDEQASNIVREKPAEPDCSPSSVLDALVGKQKEIRFDPKNWAAIQKNLEEAVKKGPLVRAADVAGKKEWALRIVVGDEARTQLGDSAERQRLAFIKQMEIQHTIPLEAQKILDEWKIKGWPDEGQIYNSASFAADAISKKKQAEIEARLTNQYRQGYLDPKLQEKFQKEFSEKLDDEKSSVDEKNTVAARNYRAAVALLNAMKSSPGGYTLPSELYLGYFHGKEDVDLDAPSALSAQYRLSKQSMGSSVLEIVPTISHKSGGEEGTRETRAISELPLARFMVTPTEAESLAKWIEEVDANPRRLRDQSGFPLSGERLAEFCRSLPVTGDVQRKARDEEIKLLQGDS
ncbi:MAG: hypothetical protein ABIR96_10145 [Bdellovibrionota bacterium]